MELAIIVVLLLIVAVMGTIIVNLFKENARLKIQVELFKDSFLKVINSIRNGGNTH